MKTTVKVNGTELGQLLNPCFRVFVRLQLALRKCDLEFVERRIIQGILDFESKRSEESNVLGIQGVS